MSRSFARYWLIPVLLGANLVVGVLSLYFVRSVNDRYAALFEHGAPAIYNLRTLTREVNGVQRLARRILSPDHEPEWASLVPQMAEARDRLATRVHDVGSMEVFQGTAHPAALRATSQEYATHASRFLQLVAGNRLADAADFNLAVLRPSHDRFQLVVDASADHVEAQGRNLRDRYARESRFFGGLSLAFASVPIVAVSAGMLMITVLGGLLFLAILDPRADRR